MKGDKNMSYSIEKEKDCIFCRIIRGEAPADFFYQDEIVIVIKDIRPRAPVHLLILPKEHIRSINELREEDHSLISTMVFTGKNMAKELGIWRTGYKLLINVEQGAGQDIFHIHMHLLGGFNFGL